MKRALVRLIVVALGLLVSTAAHAQELPTWVGARAETVTPEIMTRRGLPFPLGTVIVAVTPGGAADKAGLKVDDLILSIGNRPVTDVATLARALGDQTAGTRMEINRVRKGEAPTTIALIRPAPTRRPATMALGAPWLMLDTGGHMSLVNAIRFTPDGRHLLSAADDKVVRVWDWQAGRTVRTIRGESGPGSAGKVFAMAMSPDGRWLALAGWMKEPGVEGHHVRLHDFATGQIVALLRGHTDVVLSLAFSPDGRRLVSGSGDYEAILWDVENRKLLHRLKGHTDDIYSAAFSPDGAQVITASYDKTARMWNVTDGGLAGRLQHADKVRAVAVRQRDGMIATGDNASEIKLWDKAGEPLHTLKVPSKGIGAIAFTPDGGGLIASSGTVAGKNRVTHWSTADWRVVSEYDNHDNIVLAAAISPDGQWAASAGGSQRAIHVWKLANAERYTGADSKPVAMMGTGAPGWATGFARDGSRIAWGSTWTQSDQTRRGPLEHQLRLPLAGASLGRPERLPQTKDGKSADDAFVRATAASGGLTLVPRKGGRAGHTREAGILDIRRDATTLGSIERGPTDGYEHRSYGLVPGNQVLVSGGSNGHLAAHGLDGKRIGTFIGHEGDVWALTPSPDGKYLVSGSSDQTIRLWNLETRELIVSLFQGRDGEWVMWTEQGFFTGSPGGGALVGWQINNGPGKEAEYVSGEQLRKTLDRRDIIERAIRLASADAAVKEAFPQGFSLASLLSQRPPEMRIAAPLPRPDGHPTAFGGRVTVLLHVAHSELRLDRLDFFINEQKVSAQRVSIPARAPRAPEGWDSYAFDVPLYRGMNDIAVVAANAAGTTPVNAHKIKVEHTGEGALDKYGTLHIVAVGVDQYPGLGQSCLAADAKTAASCNLRFAGKDARAFAETAVREMGPLHAKVAMRLLVNGAGGQDEPTRANVEAAMRALESAGPTDTVVVFLAGHGEQGDGGRYHFLPTDIAGRGIADAGQGRNLMDWSAIQEPVTKALGRRLMFVDACQAGQAQSVRGYNDRLLGDARANRFTVFTATSPDQLAEEHPRVGHGFFTLALIEGLKGKAIDARERSVRAYGLGSFLTREVRAMSNGRQEPEFYSGHGDIVLVRK